MKKYLFLTVILMITCSSSFAEIFSNVYISVEELEDKGIIQTDIRGIGGHSEECIDFNIQNLKADTVYVLIEPGRRLISQDTILQDILILKMYKIILPPLASSVLKVYGFCCQSSNSSPSEGALFNTGFMAPDTWVTFAEYIDKHTFPPNAVQHAVWVLSDNHPVSSIYHKNARLVYPLKKFVAQLKNIEMPWYSLTFQKDTASLFSHKAEKIWGTIDYTVRNNAVISVNVRDSNNTVVAELIKEVAKNPGEYTFHLEMSVINWPKGQYTIYIIENYSNINTTKKFSL